jgi:glycosyltransferase involved in cell wall biosynthesis
VSDEAARVAVIVPTYNAARHLEACLASLTDLDEPEGGYEVLVVDGGSTDRTLSIARAHDVAVLEAPGTGIAEARNRAAKATAAEVLVFVDADCRAPADLLTAAEAHLDKHGVVGAFYEPAPDRGWIARTWLAIEAKAEGTVGWVPAGTMALSREAFDVVDGFREDLRASEDVDLCRRVRAAGLTVYHEPAMASQHLGQPDRLTSFFANEVTRSASLVRSVREAEGFDAEHVTLALAVAYLVAPVLLVAAGFLGVLWVAGVLGLLAAPTVAWALSAAGLEHWQRWPAAVALLVVYNVARAVSLVEYRQWRDLTG